MTMSSADFLDEWFETEVLKATMSASGIIGTFMGPRSPGTAYVLLHHYMGELDGALSLLGFCPRRNGDDQPSDRGCGAPLWRRNSNTSASGPGIDQAWPGLRRRARIGRGDSC